MCLGVIPTLVGCSLNERKASYQWVWECVPYLTRGYCTTREAHKPVLFSLERVITLSRLNHMSGAGPQFQTA